MEWKEVRLGDVIDYKKGFAFKSSMYKSTGTYIVRVSDTTANSVDVSLCNCISPELAHQYTDYSLKTKDIIIATVGSWPTNPASIVGKVVRVPESANNALLNQNAVRIRSNGIVDSDYIYYLLKEEHFSKYLVGTAQGSANQASITLKDIFGYSFSAPSEIKDQRRIASILSSLDRKIELNNKINADLEEMAQAIFKNWFVDFEPFKDGKFVNSELGMIPEGWKVVAFDNILKVTTMKTGKEGIPEYSVTNTGIHPRDEKFTKNLSKSSAKNKLIRKGNLVFGMSREILNWGIMKEEVGGVSSAYNVYVVDENIVNSIYLECFIAQRMDYFADLIKPASREGQGVDKALLLKKIICIPPSEIMDVFLEKYDSIMHLAEIRKQESSHLSLLRDTLLPRLMSGELEVPE